MQKRSPVPEAVPELSEAATQFGRSGSEDCPSERSERVPQLLGRSEERLASAAPAHAETDGERATTNTKELEVEAPHAHFGF